MNQDNLRKIKIKEERKQKCDGGGGRSETEKDFKAGKKGTR